MIIGDRREEVIENIRTAAEGEAFYNKVEVSDPVLTEEECAAIVRRYLDSRGSVSFKTKSFAARRAANLLSRGLNAETEILGMEKLKAVSGGALITSNHFSPIENTVIRYLALKQGKRRLHVVSQVTNLAMPGVIGFLMNYADIIPISADLHYLQREFVSILSDLMKRKEYVLIYPEQEMWFNYRKPRPPKIGAYHYAAKLGTPVISCFVEMVDGEKKEKGREEFYKVRYVLHVLDVLTPDPEKSVRENSRLMCARDYELKKTAYERAYGKPLTYDFEDSDIAGWVGHGNEA